MRLRSYYTHSKGVIHLSIEAGELPDRQLSALAKAITRQNLYIDNNKLLITTGIIAEYILELETFKFKIEKEAEAAKIKQAEESLLSSPNSEVSQVEKAISGISSGFNWDQTSEGDGYWRTVIAKLSIQLNHARVREKIQTEEQAKLAAKAKEKAEALVLQQKKDLERINQALQSLCSGFIWSKTPQGLEYWSQVDTNLRIIREKIQASIGIKIS